MEALVEEPHEFHHNVGELKIMLVFMKGVDVVIVDNGCDSIVTASHVLLLYRFDEVVIEPIDDIVAQPGKPVALFEVRPDAGNAGTRSPVLIDMRELTAIAKVIDEVALHHGFGGNCPCNHAAGNREVKNVEWVALRAILAPEFQNLQLNTVLEREDVHNLRATGLFIESQHLENRCNNDFISMEDPAMGD